METAYKIFDRARVKAHRARAANALGTHDFLLREIAERIADRLADLRQDFPMALDLGAHNGALAATLQAGSGIKTLVQSDLSEPMIKSCSGVRLVVDEELLPFAADSFDLVLSAGSMHWINDLPGTLIQINHVLKSGGLFIAVMPGGETLKELRQSFEAAEMTLTGGVSPRISPFIDARDGGSLLQRAGFSEPVADSETLSVLYGHPLKLMHELRSMGESNAMAESVKHFTGVSLIMAMADHYLRHFSDEHGRIMATFELVTLTAFKA